MYAATGLRRASGRVLQVVTGKPTAANTKFEDCVMSTAVQERPMELWETPHTLYGILSTVDHKKLGKRYLATAFAFLLIGGIEALVMRIQLAHSQSSLLTPEEYNQLFTMHAMTMIFLVCISRFSPGSPFTLSH